MTRMQKWESYRQEIDQSSRLGQTLALQSQKVEKYKRDIDKINPAILQNVKNVDLHLHKGVSEVVVSQKQVPAHITKLFKGLKKAKTVTNKNTVSTILFNLKNDNILDQDKKIKSAWLDENTDYAQLAAYIKAANLDLNKDKELQKELQTKFETLSTTKAQAQVGMINPLSKNDQKNIGHHVFVISIAIAIVFFVLTFVLLLVRWFA